MIQVTKTKHGGRVIILDEKDQLPDFLKPGMIAISVVGMERDVFLTLEELKDITAQITGVLMDQKIQKRLEAEREKIKEELRRAPITEGNTMADIIRRARKSPEQVAQLLAEKTTVLDPEEMDPEDPRADEEAREACADEQGEALLKIAKSLLGTPEGVDFVVGSLSSIVDREERQTKMGEGSVSSEEVLERFKQAVYDSVDRGTFEVVDQLLAQTELGDPEPSDCDCIDCGGDQPGHTPECSYMEETHGPFDGQEWKPDYSVTPRRVVCAANRNRKTGRIICGARHWDKVMRSQKREDESWVGWDQGFIDQFGDFLTREEAWEVAAHQFQILRRCGVDGEQLFSEHLY